MRLKIVPTNRGRVYFGVQGKAVRPGTCSIVVALVFSLQGMAQSSPLQPAGAYQSTATHAPVTLSLKDALALAEKNDPNVLAVAADIATAREDRNQARAAAYPTLSGRSEYLGTQGDGKLPSGRFVTNDGVHVYRDWAVIHQDLSPGTLKRTAVQKADAATALARARLEVARRSLAYTVTKNYYALIAAQRKYVSAQQSLDQAQRFLTISRELEQGREVAHSDVVRATLQENTQEQSLQEATLAMESARLDLAVLLFRGFDENFTVIDDLDGSPALPLISEAETMASSKDPTLAAAMQSLRGATIDATIARQAYLPTLTIDAVYGIEANAFALRSTVAANKEVGAVPNLGYFVTASLNIPIWDWGIRHSRVRQAEIKQAQAAVDLTVAQRVAVRNLRSAYNEAQTSRQQLDLQRTAVELSSESLRVNTLRYRAGEATILEVVDAQTALTASKNALSDGLVRHRIAISNLQTLTGTF